MAKNSSKDKQFSGVLVFKYKLQPLKLIRDLHKGATIACVRLIP